MIRLYFKLILHRFKPIPSFCKKCGVKWNDFKAPDWVWRRLEPYNTYGTPLCANCILEFCKKIGFKSTWELHPNLTLLESEYETCESCNIRAADVLWRSGHDVPLCNDCCNGLDKSNS